MPVMSEYPPGAPCWVDLSTAEPAASLSFYTGLFGWASYAAPGGGDAAYTFFAPAGRHRRTFPAGWWWMMPSPAAGRPAAEHLRQRDRHRRDGGEGH